MLFFSRRDRCTLSPLLSCRLAPSVFSSRFGLLWGIYFLEWGVGGFLFVCVCWRGREGLFTWCAYRKRLSPTPSPHWGRCTLIRCAGTRDPRMQRLGGAHQGDYNPTLDVSTRLRVGMPPLGGQATGYPFQGSRCLHPQNYKIDPPFLLFEKVNFFCKQT